jgi:hypothetical protein
MKSIVMWLAMRGLINHRWFRIVGGWLIRRTGVWK